MVYYIMDYKKVYKCVDCGTPRYLIFPHWDESLVICSACFRERRIKEEEKEIIYT